MGKTSQQLGKTGEEIAFYFLKSIGARCIEKIATPMTNVKGKAVYCKKSSVDIIAAVPQPGSIYPYGAARIEVKLCDDNKLSHSRLSSHQQDWLLEWYNCSLPAFVLWIHRQNCFMFQYPSNHFVAGKSLHVDDAKKISVWNDTLK